VKTTVVAAHAIELIKASKDANFM